MFPNPSGSRYWRLIDPAKYLNRYGWDCRVVEEGGITDEVLQWADITVLQMCVDMKGIAAAVAYSREGGKKLVVDVDDVIDIDPDNPYRPEHIAAHAPEVLRIAIKNADLVTTTTRRLMKYLQELNPRIALTPNMMDMERWDLPILPNDSGRLRIGWVGSLTHYQDLAMIAEPLRRIRAEFPQVELVFMGDPRVEEFFGRERAEYMLGVPFDAYPARLHGLRLDIGLAPLRATPFNRGKSPIKWMEYAMVKAPAICSPVPYSFRGFDGHFGMVATSPEQWYSSIKNLILFPQLRQDIANQAFAYVRRNYDLKTEIKAWIDAYKSLT